MKQVYPIETPIGNIEISVSAEGQIFVDGNGDGKFVTVNRVPVGFSFHMYRQEDGSFAIPQEPTGGYCAGEPIMRDAYTYFNRTDSHWNDKKEVSPATMQKIKAIIIPLANEWAKEHMTELAESWEKYRLEKVKKKFSEVSQKLREVDILNAELAEIKQARNPYKA